MHWFQWTYRPITDEVKECVALQAHNIQLTYGNRNMDSPDIIANKKVRKEVEESFQSGSGIGNTSSGIDDALVEIGVVVVVVVATS